MAEAIRKRWPEMRVLHLPNYDRLAEELRHGYFCGYSLRAEQLKEGKKLEVDSFDGGGRGAIDVSGVAGFRDHGDEPEWNFLRADGGAHHGIAAGAGAEFS